uniref:Uncharacterized protein n=1 Tax=Panagrolaimus sp. PS1159 TaxID=55785 RepID=A0AC35G5A1_9BILA
MDKSMADDNFDLEIALKAIMVETLQKDEKENPIKNSIAKYHSFAKIITDASTLKTVLQRIKKAKAKLIGEIQVMEELERKEEEKKARDQAEAERNEKLKKELGEMYLSVSGHKELPNLDDPSLVIEEVIDLIKSRKQTFIQHKEKLSQII